MKQTSKKQWLAAAMAAVLVSGLTGVARADDDVYDEINPAKNTPAQVNEGVVQRKTIMGMDPEAQNILLQPGRGEFKIKSLSFGERVVMVLDNQTSSPLRFETVRRAGKEKSWVIPANTREIVSMLYLHPLSDTVSYNVTPATP